MHCLFLIYGKAGYVTEKSKIAYTISGKDVIVNCYYEKVLNDETNSDNGTDTDNE